VVAIATVKGTGVLVTRPPKVLTFSGYQWNVRDIPSDRGGAHDYDPDNDSTDAEGLLHLRLTRRDDRWTSAEVIDHRRGSCVIHGSRMSNRLIKPFSNLKM
jgi:hypothetical protein